MIVRVYDRGQRLSSVWPLGSVNGREEEPFNNVRQASIATGTVSTGFHIQGSSAEFRRLAADLEWAADCLDTGRVRNDGLFPPKSMGIGTPRPEYTTSPERRKPKRVKLHVFKIVQNHYQRYFVFSSTGVFVRGPINGTMKFAVEQAKIDPAGRTAERVDQVKMKGVFTEAEAERRVKELRETYGIKS